MMRVATSTESMSTSSSNLVDFNRLQSQIIDNLQDLNNDFELDDYDFDQFNNYLNNAITFDHKNSHNKDFEVFVQDEAYDDDREEEDDDEDDDDDLSDISDLSDDVSSSSFSSSLHQNDTPISSTNTTPNNLELDIKHTTQPQQQPQTQKVRNTQSQTVPSPKAKIRSILSGRKTSFLKKFSRKSGSEASEDLDDITDLIQEPGFDTYHSQGNSQSQDDILQSGNVTSNLYNDIESITNVSSSNSSNEYFKLDITLGNDVTGGLGLMNNSEASKSSSEIALPLNNGPNVIQNENFNELINGNSAMKVDTLSANFVKRDSTFSPTTLKLNLSPVEESFSVRTSLNRVLNYDNNAANESSILEENTHYSSDDNYDMESLQSLEEPSTYYQIKMVIDKIREIDEKNGSSPEVYQKEEPILEDILEEHMEEPQSIFEPEEQIEEPENDKKHVKLPEISPLMNKEGQVSFPSNYIDFGGEDAEKTFSPEFKRQSVNTKIEMFITNMTDEAAGPILKRSSGSQGRRNRHQRDPSAVSSYYAQSTYHKRAWSGDFGDDRSILHEEELSNPFQTTPSEHSSHKQVTPMKFENISESSTPLKSVNLSASNSPTKVKNIELESSEKRETQDFFDGLDLEGDSSFMNDFMREANSRINSLEMEPKKDDLSRSSFESSGSSLMSGRVNSGSSSFEDSAKGIEFESLSTKVVPVEPVAVDAALKYELGEPAPEWAVQLDYSHDEEIMISDVHDIEIQEVEIGNIVEQPKKQKSLQHLQQRQARKQKEHNRHQDSRKDNHVSSSRHVQVEKKKHALYAFNSEGSLKPRQSFMKDELRSPTYEEEQPKKHELNSQIDEETADLVLLNKNFFVTNGRRTNDIYNTVKVDYRHKNSKKAVSKSEEGIGAYQKYINSKRGNDTHKAHNGTQGHGDKGANRLYHGRSIIDIYNKCQQKDPNAVKTTMVTAKDIQKIKLDERLFKNERKSVMSRSTRSSRSTATNSFVTSRASSSITLSSSNSSSNTLTAGGSSGRTYRENSSIQRGLRNERYERSYRNKTTSTLLTTTTNTSARNPFESRTSLGTFSRASTSIASSQSQSRTVSMVSSVGSSYFEKYDQSFDYVLDTESIETTQNIDSDDEFGQTRRNTLIRVVSSDDLPNADVGIIYKQFAN